MNQQHKEKKFLDSLESLFTGTEIDGDSGFANLTRIKHQYFQSIRPTLTEKIEQCTELDNLYKFFKQYFNKSGSIYDVADVGSNNMLYYVKSDVLVHSMPVELRDRSNPEYRRQFYFDVSDMEHKRNNEKREFIFAFDMVDNTKGKQVLCLKVSYSEKGGETKVDDIIKQAHKNNLKISDRELEKACRIFRRQPEVDFFINKDARGFLREQFDLWLYQYMFKEETVFKQPRLNQLHAVKKTAYEIIDFIAKFEGELKRVWEKPKLVRDVNYVVTLDKLSDCILKKIVKHKGAGKQVKEWQQLGLVDDKFSMKMIFKGQKSFEDKNSAGEDCKFLPIDTKHFKDLELEILDALGNLEEALDGELVHSENWQALNTLKKRYKGKVKCIYIDPPFNLDSSDQFDYRTNYKDSCWEIMLESRLALAKTLLSETGSIFVRCDYNGNWIVRPMLDEIFGADNFVNEIALAKSNRIKTPGRKFLSWHETLFFYGKSENRYFDHLKKKRGAEENGGIDEWRSIDNAGEVWGKIPLEIVNSLSPENVKYDDEGHPRSRARIIFGKEKLPPSGRRYPAQEAIWKMEEQEKIRINSKGTPQMKKQEFTPLTDNWTDLFGYSSSWDFSTENAESVLDRVICSSSHGESITLDFFSGSGTTQSVSQKLGRKWLGVEMGAHFHTVILPRMKKVIGGHQSGISKQIEYRGGGAFKYYSLEQYEETLKNASYNDDKSALEINIHDLYSDIDIAESLSNILGKPIRHRTAESVTFADGAMEKINLEKMTEAEKQHFTSLMKPYAS